MCIADVVEKLLKTETPDHCELVADAFEQWARCCKHDPPKQTDLRNQALELRTAAKLARQAKEQEAQLKEQAQ